MDSFEWNKGFAAIVGTALFVMLVTSFSDSVFHREEGVKPSYTIEVETAVVETVVEEGPTLAEILSVADADRGAQQWGKCRACHTIDKGGKNGIGPNLYDIVGRGVAADGTFKYSKVLAAGQDASWTWELLDAWLKSPKKTFKGTTMGFAGIKKDGQRADLMAYLAAMSDAPLALPTVEKIVDMGGEAVEEAVTAQPGQ